MARLVVCIILWSIHFYLSKEPCNMDLIKQKMITNNDINNDNNNIKSKNINDKMIEVIETTLF